MLDINNPTDAFAMILTLQDPPHSEMSIVEIDGQQHVHFTVLGQNLEREIGQ